MDAEVVRAVIEGIEEGKVAREPGTACLRFIFEHLDAQSRAETLGHLAERYLSALEEDRAGPLHDAIMAASRPKDTDALAMSSAAASVLVEAGGLSPTATREAQTFVDMIGLLRGQWRGKALDAETIRAETDRQHLHLFADKVDDPALAHEAHRQLIRLDIRKSPYPEVQADVEAVVERVLETGRNAIDPSTKPILSGRFLPRAKMRAEVHQNPLIGESILQIEGGASPQDPFTLHLRGWL